MKQDNSNLSMTKYSDLPEYKAFPDKEIFLDAPEWQREIDPFLTLNLIAMVADLIAVFFDEKKDEEPDERIDYASNCVSLLEALEKLPGTVEFYQSAKTPPNSLSHVVANKADLLQWSFREQNTISNQGIFHKGYINKKNLPQSYQDFPLATGHKIGHFGTQGGQLEHRDVVAFGTFNPVPQHPKRGYLSLSQEELNKIHATTVRAMSADLDPKKESGAGVSITFVVDLPTQAKIILDTVNMSNSYQILITQTIAPQKKMAVKVINNAHGESKFSGSDATNRIIAPEIKRTQLELKENDPAEKQMFLFCATRGLRTPALENDDGGESIDQIQSRLTEHFKPYFYNQGYFNHIGSPTNHPGCFSNVLLHTALHTQTEGSEDNWSGLFTLLNPSSPIPDSVPSASDSVSDVASMRSANSNSQNNSDTRSSVQSDTMSESSIPSEAVAEEPKVFCLQTYYGHGHRGATLARHLAKIYMPFFHINFKLHLFKEIISNEAAEIKSDIESVTLRQAILKGNIEEALNFMQHIDIISVLETRDHLDLLPFELAYILAELNPENPKYAQVLICISDRMEKIFSPYFEIKPEDTLDLPTKEKLTALKKLICQALENYGTIAFLKLSTADLNEDSREISEKIKSLLQEFKHESTSPLRQQLLAEIERLKQQALFLQGDALAFNNALITLLGSVCVDPTFELGEELRQKLEYIQTCRGYINNAIHGILSNPSSAKIQHDVYDANIAALISTMIDQEDILNAEKRRLEVQIKTHLKQDKQRRELSAKHNNICYVLECIKSINNNDEKFSHSNKLTENLCDELNRLFDNHCSAAEFAQAIDETSKTFKQAAKDDDEVKTKFIALLNRIYQQAIQDPNQHDRCVAMFQSICELLRDANVSYEEFPTIDEADESSLVDDMTKRGQLDFLKIMIATLGANVNEVNPVEGSLLHIAAKNGHLELFKFLVAKKANLNYQFKGQSIAKVATPAINNYLSLLEQIETTKISMKKSLENSNAIAQSLSSKDASKEPSKDPSRDHKSDWCYEANGINYYYTANDTSAMDENAVSDSCGANAIAHVLDQIKFRDNYKDAQGFTLSMREVIYQVLFEKIRDPKIGASLRRLIGMQILQDYKSNLPIHLSASYKKRLETLCKQYDESKDKNDDALMNFLFSLPLCEDYLEQNILTEEFGTLVLKAFLEAADISHDIFIEYDLPTIPRTMALPTEFHYVSSRANSPIVRLLQTHLMVGTVKAPHYVSINFESSEKISQVEAKATTQTIPHLPATKSIMASLKGIHQSKYLSSKQAAIKRGTDAKIEKTQPSSVKDPMELVKIWFDFFTEILNAKENSFNDTLYKEGLLKIIDFLVLKIKTEPPKNIREHLFNKREIALFSYEVLIRIHNKINAETSRDQSESELKNQIEEALNDLEVERPTDISPSERNWLNELLGSNQESFKEGTMAQMTIVNGISYRKDSEAHLKAASTKSANQGIASGRRNPSSAHTDSPLIRGSIPSRNPTQTKKKTNTGSQNIATIPRT